MGLFDGMPYVFIVLEYPRIKRCQDNIRHIYNRILSESDGVLLFFND